jgi:methyl-accepting chemotaxis protein
MKVDLLKKNSNLIIGTFLISLLITSVFAKTAFGSDRNRRLVLIPTDKGRGALVTNQLIERGILPSPGSISKVGQGGPDVPPGRAKSLTLMGYDAYGQPYTLLIASKNAVDIVSRINNQISDHIDVVGQDTEDFQANLRLLIPSENQVNLSALAPTNVSAQKLRNSILGLLHELNQIPDNSTEVSNAKQMILNDLSVSVVNLEQTNDLIQSITQAVGQSE